MQSAAVSTVKLTSGYREDKVFGFSLYLLEEPLLQATDGVIDKEDGNTWASTLIESTNSLVFKLIR